MYFHKISRSQNIPPSLHMEVSLSVFLSVPWWRHQMEAFSALLALCAGNSPVPTEFPAQRPVTRSFDVFFDLHLNKPLSKQSWGWWFEMPSCSLWRQCNALRVHGQANHNHSVQCHLRRSLRTPEPRWPAYMLTWWLLMSWRQNRRQAISNHQADSTLPIAAINL